MRKGNSLILAAVALLILLVSGCTQGNNAQGQAGQQDTGTQQGAGSQQNGEIGAPQGGTGQEGISVEEGAGSGDSGTGAALQNYTIEVTDSGYSPQELTIKQGDTVMWVNNSAREDWPASARPLTYTVYPGSGIEKCGTPKQSAIFDACRALKKGESFSFTFNEKGSWAYHDHVAAKTFGRITVE